MAVQATEQHRVMCPCYHPNILGPQFLASTERETLLLVTVKTCHGLQMVCRKEVLQYASNLQNDDFIVLHEYYSCWQPCDDSRAKSLHYPQASKTSKGKRTCPTIRNEQITSCTAVDSVMLVEAKLCTFLEIRLKCNLTFQLLLRSPTYFGTLHCRI